MQQGNEAVLVDEPSAALGAAESAKVLALIDRIRSQGLPVVLIPHDMPHLFGIAGRIHVHRLGRRAAVVPPTEVSKTLVVGLITGVVERL